MFDYYIKILNMRGNTTDIYIRNNFLIIAAIVMNY